MSFIGKDVADTARLDAQDEAEAEANRVTAARLKAEADEQAATNAAEAAAAAFRSAEPPELPATLTNAMSPMRARLLAYTHWLTAPEYERTVAKMYLAQIGVPAFTEITPPANGTKLTVAAVDAAMKAQSIPMESRMATKQGMQRG